MFKAFPKGVYYYHKKILTLENNCSLWKKKGVLQLALLNVWVANDTCNSLYLYVASANEQIAWIVELQVIIHTMQLIAT
jgi:hypothetical protein